MDSEPTNGKLFCVNQQHVSIHQPTKTAYTDIHNSNVPSSGLEQQHEELCSAPTPWGLAASNKKYITDIYLLSSSSLQFRNIILIKHGGNISLLKLGFMSTRPKTFRTVTLLTGHQETHPACKKPVYNNFHKFAFVWVVWPSLKTIHSRKSTLYSKCVFTSACNSSLAWHNPSRIPSLPWTLWYQDYSACKNTNNAQPYNGNTKICCNNSSRPPTKNSLSHQITCSQKLKIQNIYSITCYHLSQSHISL